MLKRSQVHAKFFSALLLTLIVFLLLSPDAFASSRVHGQFIGPKKHFLALGDSLAFGYQPDGDYKHGYVADFFAELQKHGVQDGVDIGCPGETSKTFIVGHCPYAPAHVPPQLLLALGYLRLHAGDVSPVTLDIGANDLLNDTTVSNCTVNQLHFTLHLLSLDANLRLIILPALHAALKVHGQVTGDLLVMNYYDPYQNTCPNLVSYTQVVNAHIARDIASYATLVDVFSAFGGAKTPNPSICQYTWICAAKPDIHGTDRGYQVIAQAFEKAYTY